MNCVILLIKQINIIYITLWYKSSEVSKDAYRSRLSKGAASDR